MAGFPDPKDLGAKTAADVGVFLFGAFVGGGLDAVLNVAGFAEPLVFAGICGAGALGPKKIIDAWRDGDAKEGNEDR